MFDLFDVEDHLLVINKKEIRGIKAFRALLANDKGSEGDSDGRDKLLAMQELLYMYFMNHPNSMYRDLPTKERIAIIRKNIRLPEKWKEHKIYKEAERVYVEGLELTGTYKAFIEASRSVYSIGDDLKLFGERRYKIKEHLKKVTSTLETTDSKDERYSELLQRENDLTDRLMKVTENIQKITGTLDGNYEILEKLKKRLAKEEGNKAEVRGGGLIGKREK